MKAKMLLLVAAARRKLLQAGGGGAAVVPVLLHCWLAVTFFRFLTTPNDRYRRRASELLLPVKHLAPGDLASEERGDKLPTRAQRTTQQEDAPPAAAPLSSDKLSAIIHQGTC